MLDINLHNCSPDNKFTSPTGYYKIIITANEALAHIESIMEKDQDYTNFENKIIRGYLVGLRSWAYFTLVRLYGEAAYLEDNIVTLPDNLNLNYYNREEMIDILIIDLDTLLGGDRDRNRVLGYLDLNNEYTLYCMYNRALMGELYLEKNNYEKAAEYLKMAIEGYENRYFKVGTSYQKENWKNIFINSHSFNDEVMVAVPFSLDNNQLNPLENWTASEREYLIQPSSYIINLFNSQKTSDGKNGDIHRGFGVSYDSTKNIKVINKHILDKSIPASSDIILYRAADIHLLYAEALNRLGDQANALQLLNSGYKDAGGAWRTSLGVRGRVYLTPKGISQAATDKTAYLEDLIMDERAMELAFEGKRWFDLMRVARRRGNDYLANKVAAKFSDADTAQQIHDLLMEEANWYLPFNK